MLQAALAYATAGWAVVPLIPTTKKPLIKTGTDHAGAATCDLIQVREWWTRWEDAGIGLVPATSGHVVIDVDGEPGRETFAEHPGPFPCTATVRSGREAFGMHLYYRVPPGVKVPRSRQLGPGLELKAAGNLVVLPPSLHKSGRRYRWEVPPSRVACQPPPAWMLEEPVKTTKHVRKVVVLKDGAQADDEGAARMRGILRLVENEPHGGRHARNYWAARMLRALHDAGHVAADVALDRLRRAIEWNCETSGVPGDPKEIEETISDGWAKGGDLGDSTWQEWLETTALKGGSR
jgi:hypothetical protein